MIYKILPSLQAHFGMVGLVNQVTVRYHPPLSTAILLSVRSLKKITGTLVIGRFSLKLAL